MYNATPKVVPCFIAIIVGLTVVLITLQHQNEISWPTNGIKSFEDHVTLDSMPPIEEQTLESSDVDVSTICRRPSIISVEASLPLVYSNTFFQNDIMVHDRSKTLFCIPPKAGHMFWVASLPRMVSGFHIVPMDTFDRNERKFRYETYQKVAVVREPFRRLWSAYNDRLVRAHRMMIHVGGNIHELTREGTPKKPCVSNITFDEFASYIIYSYNQSQRMRHTWRTYTQLCRPCALDYDFVFQMEKFKEHFETFKKIADLPPGASVMSTPINRTFAELKLLHGETDEIIKCITFQEYRNSKWAAMKNRGLVRENATIPPDLETKVKLTNYEKRLDFNKKLREALYSKLEADIAEDKGVVTKRREHLVYKAIRALPVKVRCDLYNIYKADFDIFGYPVDNYDLEICNLK